MYSLIHIMPLPCAYVLFALFQGKAAPAGARSAMAAFKQMDTANNPNSGSVARPK